MMRTSSLLLSAVVALGVIAAGGWYLLKPSTPESNSARMVFKAAVGDEPFIRNEYAYRNPGGDGEFQIRDFRLFLSNFVFEGPEGIHVEPDSYHLLRFDNPESQFVLEFPSMPLSAVKRVSFAVGVDQKANTSLEPQGDLDPNSQMAWNWEVGYKFVLFEGSLRTENETQPLVYHVGFSENLRPLSYTFSDPIDLESADAIHFRVDALKMFAGSTTIDLEELPTVKFDRTDAKLLADNYRDMIDLVKTEMVSKK